MKKLPIQDIALPTGVKGLKKYIEKNSEVSETSSIFTVVKKGTPAHVKASVIYNDLLRHFGLEKKYEKISDGSKIKWAYIKPNQLQIPAIGFKGYEDPDKIMNFIEQYVDHDKIFDSVLQKKIDLFYKALGWNAPIDKEKSLEKFF
jgi:hypothetical protein